MRERERWHTIIIWKVIVSPGYFPVSFLKLNFQMMKAQTAQTLKELVNLTTLFLWSPDSKISKYRGSKWSGMKGSFPRDRSVIAEWLTRAFISRREKREKKSLLLQCLGLPLQGQYTFQKVLEKLNSYLKERGWGEEKTLNDRENTVLHFLPKKYMSAVQKVASHAIWQTCIYGWIFPQPSYVWKAEKHGEDRVNKYKWVQHLWCKHLYFFQVMDTENIASPARQPELLLCRFTQAQ